MSSISPRPSSLFGGASVTVGITPDGEAPAGTGVASVRGAAWAGVVRSGGAGGDGQDFVRPVGPDQVGRELDRSLPLFRGEMRWRGSGRAPQSLTRT
jgi:hypothetical protein